MLGTVIQPKNKSDLIKSLQSMTNPKIEVVDINSRSDKTKVTQTFDKMGVKGSFSVIFIKE